MKAAQRREQYLDFNITKCSLKKVIGAIVPCMTLGLIALVLRLASRRTRGSRFLLSDYLAIAGWMCAWAVGLAVIQESRIAEVQPMTPSNRRTLLKISFVTSMSYSIGFTLIKLSIVLLYRQLFPTKFIRASTTILTFCIIGWGFSLVIATIFTCQPIHGFWDVDIPSKCFNTKWFSVGNGIPNIIIDVCLLCLPGTYFYSPQWIFQPR
ncbi:hypothetical protein F5B19DRAFT_465273 [Rostrohypoxylon terebratum]|nr:hypothetical protein F5B19DRAFT_465273 [Rostrohypoxylon terebratum]